MTVNSHSFRLGGATGNAALGPETRTVALWAYSDDARDTGESVLSYLVAQGFRYGLAYAVGNDTSDRHRLVEIGAPELVDGSCSTWAVSLRYELVPPFENFVSGEITIPDSPVTQRPEITIRNAGREVATSRAYYLGGLTNDWDEGEWRAVTTSAGEPFQGLMTLRFHSRITISRYTTAVDFNVSDFPEDWVNEKRVEISNGSTKFTAAEHTLRHSGWEVSETEEGGVPLSQVVWTGEHRFDGWIDEVLDAGTLALARPGDPDGRGGTVSASDLPAGVPGTRVIHDKSGRPATNPVPLNGNGVPMDESFNGATNAVYSRWLPYDQVDVPTIGFFAGLAKSS